MTEPSSEIHPQYRWTPNANDRMKARWRGLVGWGTIFAAGFHAALFAFWPTWERSRSESDPLQDFLQLEWVSVLEARSLPSADPAPAVQLGAVPDSLREEVEIFAATSGTGTEIATLSEAFRERLIGRSAPQPSLSESESADEATNASGGSSSEGESIEVDGGLSSVDFSEILGSSPLDLDRLSAVRPELVMVAPSAWVLIRNPIEVEQFIVRSYRIGQLDRSANGSVSVALWIDARGSVEWAEISRSSGLPEMDQVALELFSEVAAFRPARDQGVAVPRSVIFSVHFPWY